MQGFTLSDLNPKSVFIFSKILFLSLLEREHEQEAGPVQAGGEAGFPLSRSPDAGLDLKTPGS